MTLHGETIVGKNDRWSHGMSVGKSGYLDKQHHGYAPSESGFIISVSELIRSKWGDQQADAFLASLDGVATYEFECHGLFIEDNDEGKATGFDLRCFEVSD